VERFRPVFNHYGIRLIIPDVQERMEEDDILEYAGQFDGVISGDDRYSARVIEACLPRLKVISKWGTGIDSIDAAACAQHNIKVGRTLNAFTNPVADTVLGYILAFARQQPWMDKAMKAGVWEKIPGRSLGECTIGVIGIGRIGKAVIRRASAFGMTLLGNDIIEVDPHFVNDHRLEITSLDELLARADFVSMNTDLNPTSYHLMNVKTLDLMRDNAVLINTSRGAVVDEAALITALENKKLGGAALDVFEKEPLPDSSPLRKIDNVMLAPHNSNSSPTAWERIHWKTIQNLLDGFGIDSSELDQFQIAI
jgi:D-3-phosphoglycerate dehydrogenase